MSTPNPGDVLPLWNPDIPGEEIQSGRLGIRIRPGSPAAEKVRAQVTESTWLAFWWTAVDGLSGKEVGGKLKMSVAAVFVAKSRVMLKLKEQIAAATDDC